MKPRPNFSRKRPHESTNTATKDDSLEAFRKQLPVYAFRKSLLQAIGARDDHAVVLITAATGSGKSTQIPAYLLSSSHRIAVTQPRRVAAMTLAQRVAKEQESLVGRRVGYRVRFENCSGPETQLIYVTDGMLLREAMVDPQLSRYGVVFLDEAHERSLQTDILLGVVFKARKNRLETSSPLRVVVMSATLQMETFETFFGKEQCKRIHIPGRQFQVQLLYTPKPVDDYLEAALSTILQIHEHEESGDILVFLPGQEEIEDLAALLHQQLKEEEATQWTGDRVVSMQDEGAISKNSVVICGVLVCQLYAALPPDAQLAAFAEKPAGCLRKIILATNIAETSVTLPDIRFVVDSGKHKSRHVTTTGIETLAVESISQDQAAQRAGRAGRVQSGLCFRLYSEPAFGGMLQTSVPEIQRVHLGQVVLQLLGMGIRDVTSFEIVSPPKKASLKRATQLLYALGALDDTMGLTSHGKTLARLPLEPTFGHLLVQSSTSECLSEMLTAVALVSAEYVFYRPHHGAAAKAAAAHKRFASHEGDLPTFVRVYQAWQQEALYDPSNRRKGRQDQRLQKSGGKRALLPHGEWCERNYISGRALVRAQSIRTQLASICNLPTSKGGLGLNVDQSCGKDWIVFYKAVSAGLFMQVASRMKVEEEDHGRGNSGSLGPNRGRYRTKVGNETVSIHPTSTMFNRHPAPACVVYTEMVTTTRTYIRCVTQIKEEWLAEVAPKFYSAEE